VVAGGCILVIGSLIGAMFDNHFRKLNDTLDKIARDIHLIEARGR